MNATLEEMARALFRSWFVEFDPVRAKAEGRQPAGMDAETAALFPDGFEETEMGGVPRGWNTAVLGDVAAVVMANHHPVIPTTKPESECHSTRAVMISAFDSLDSAFTAQHQLGSPNAAMSSSA
jgi:type I restriction enzyme S subunit